MPVSRAGWTASSSARCGRSEDARDDQVQAPAGPRRAAPGRRRGPGRAVEGYRQHPGRADQPVDRLWPGGRPERQRRPDHADAVHPADLQQHAGAVRHQGAGQRRQRAVEERRRSIGACRPAAVRQAGPADRRHRVVHRQRQEPARRQPADDSAERYRRPGLRGRPGQPGGRRLRPPKAATARRSPSTYRPPDVSRPAPPSNARCRAASTRATA